MIRKIDYTDTIEAVQGAYQQGWSMTNFGATGAPELPSGMVIWILGFPYIVEGGNELPDGTPSDGLVYVKITPNAGDSGATADAEFTNTFSGAWNSAYNNWYDGNSLFLNIFMTKASAEYNSKGFWLNWRERKMLVVSDSLTMENIAASGEAAFSAGINLLNPIVLADGANNFYRFADKVGGGSDEFNLYFTVSFSGSLRIAYTTSAEAVLVVFVDGINKGGGYAGASRLITSLTAGAWVRLQFSSVSNFSVSQVHAQCDKAGAINMSNLLIRSNNSYGL